MAEEEDFAGQFVENIGVEGDEVVKSNHALAFLVDVYVEQGDKEKAVLFLDRLAGKWDPIRAGYWNFRKREIGAK